MNIRAMRAFVELVKQKSVTEAANALCVTQPTISKLVKQLEFELNLPLMIRHGHKFELTPAGQLVFDQGSSILKQMKNLNEAINEFHTQETGILKLGMPATVGSFFFNEILSTFHERYPRILDVEQNWHLAMVWSNTRHISRPLRVWLELCEAMLPLVVEKS